MRLWEIRVLGVFLAAASAGVLKDEYVLSVVHMNDFHARFDQQSKLSGPCKPQEGQCHGGFSRLYHKVQELMASRPNPIFLNAGDNFQGTLWYNLFKWNVTQKFMNMLPIDAYTLGNHEFDDRIAGLVPFIKSMKAPCIVCNLNDTYEPEMRNIYKKSVVVEKKGKKIGLVGVITANTPNLSSPDKLIFLDEIESVNKEAKRLVEEEGVFTVVVVSHCGIELEKVMAKKSAKHIGLIVGGHSHTLLYNGETPDGSRAAGPYPVVVKRESDGKDVLVVQASAYTRYLGDIQVTYDAEGEVRGWKGDPIYLAPELPQDESVNELLMPFKNVVDDQGRKVLGVTEVNLDSETCKFDECNFGSFISDAIVYSFREMAEPGCWSYTAIGLTNSGSVRTSIPAGNVSYNDIITAQPFENTFDVGVLQGKYILEILEQTALPFVVPNQNPQPLRLIQVSGLKVTYDMSKPEGSRVKSVEVLDECSNKYAPLDLGKDYKVGMNSFLGRGGDGFRMIPNNVREYRAGKVDKDVYLEYIPKMSPIKIVKEGRLVFENLDEFQMTPVEGRSSGMSWYSTNHALLIPTVGLACFLQRQF